MFIETDLETVLRLLDKLTSDSQARWGTMSPQAMVEHLTDTLNIAMGKVEYPLSIPEDKVAKSQAFILSDHELPRDFQAVFAPANAELRNEELELAVDEFVDAFIAMEDLFERKPELTTVHPHFGSLNFELWQRLNAKHLTHHFKQFGIID